MDPSHNYKRCPKRQAKLERMKQEQANLTDESTMETDFYQYEPSDSYSVPTMCHATTLERKRLVREMDLGRSCLQGT